MYSNGFFGAFAHTTEYTTFPLVSSSIRASVNVLSDYGETRYCHGRTLYCVVAGKLIAATQLNEQSFPEFHSLSAMDYVGVDVGVRIAWDATAAATGNIVFASIFFILYYVFVINPKSPRGVTTGEPSGGKKCVGEKHLF